MPLRVKAREASRGTPPQLTPTLPLPPLGLPRKCVLTCCCEGRHHEGRANGRQGLSQTAHPCHPPASLVWQAWAFTPPWTRALPSAGHMVPSVAPWWTGHLELLPSRA